MGAQWIRTVCRKWERGKYSHRIHGTGIFTNIGSIFMVNVGKYTIHGSYAIRSFAFKKHLWLSFLSENKVNISLGAGDFSTLIWNKRVNTLNVPHSLTLFGANLNENYHLDLQQTVDVPWISMNVSKVESRWWNQKPKTSELHQGT